MPSRLYLPGLRLRIDLSKRKVPGDVHHEGGLLRGQYGQLQLDLQFERSL